MQVPKTSWERAIDVSEFNNQGHIIDWDQVVPNFRAMDPPIARVIVRATYGSNYTDSMFVSNWQALKRLGVLKGAYHAALPREVPNLEANAQQQAAHFLSAVNRQGGLLSGDWPILDLENSQGLSPDSLTLWASHWLSCVDAAIPHVENIAIFYSYPAFIESYMGILQTLSHRPLWIADYPGGTTLPHSAPPDVGDWTTYFGWQYTDQLHVSDIDGPVDGSVFAEVPPVVPPASSRSNPKSCRVLASFKEALQRQRSS